MTGQDLINFVADNGLLDYEVDETFAVLGLEAEISPGIYDVWEIHADSTTAHYKADEREEDVVYITE